MEIVISAAAVVISALIAFGGVVYTNKQSKEAKEKQESLERKQVENEAYLRARKIDEGVIERLQEEVGELRRQIVESRDRYDRLESRFTESEQKNIQIHKELLQEKELTSLLKQRLTDAEVIISRLQGLQGG